MSAETSHRSQPKLNLKDRVWVDLNRACNPRLSFAYRNAALSSAVALKRKSKRSWAHFGFYDMLTHYSIAEIIKEQFLEALHAGNTTIAGEGNYYDHVLKVAGPPPEAPAVDRAHKALWDIFTKKEGK